MNDLEALVALNKAGIGSIRLDKLLKFFIRPENIFQAPQEKLISFYGVSAQAAGQICSTKPEDIQREIGRARQLGLEIITRDSPVYPQNLKNIPGPPIVLYVKGKLLPEDKTAIGIVGSRRASFYGLEQARLFAANLSQERFTVVSGLARGVDSAAHLGALKAGGRTIAVIGSGFAHIYPPENIALAEEIAQNGAVLSEFPIESEPLAQNFPRRNRLISGLSLGVLVVEAARNSGALITADFALEQGRDVFCLPGKIDAENSCGTNALIKQGAKLVTCTEDILEEYNLNNSFASCAMPAALESAGAEPGTQSAEPVEDTICRLISERSLMLDELVEETGLDIPKISAILLKLQLKHLIRQLPGKQFIGAIDEK